MQGSYQAGKAALQPLSFDAPRKRFKACDVNTYLDAPEDVGTVFDTLPNDRIALAQSVLDATSKQVQIRTTNSS
jgi:hypothetical protein